MSLARRPFPGKARISALAGMFALPLLASCAYNDGYYDPSPGYGYDYGNGGYDYGYGGGYGGYGYNYGYGNPCWPYGCGGDWHHRRHHRQGWGDDDGDNNDGDNNHHHHHGGADDGMSGGHRFDPGRQANDVPRHVEQPDAGNIGAGQPGRRPQPPSAPNPYWIPQVRDSKQ